MSRLLETGKIALYSSYNVVINTFLQNYTNNYRYLQIVICINNLRSNQGRLNHVNCVSYMKQCTYITMLFLRSGQLNLL